jgi:CubicO group peptidase (beta-lactamase class C family)
MSTLQDLLAAAVARGEIAGGVALLAQGERVELAAAGAQEIGGVPMRRDTVFRIASVTKPIVAVAAMALVEEGRLDLDEPVDRWLPELAGRRVLRRPDGPLEDTVPARRAITLRDLLTMRMGLGAVFGPPTPLSVAMAAAGLAPGPMIFAEPADAFMRRLGTLPLAHHPGEGWLYHTASDVLGVLLGRVAKCPLSVLLRERVLGPLGMRETGFHATAAQLPRLATAYQASPDGQGLALLDAAEGGHFAAPPAFEAGGGGLVSTADDLLGFGRMMLGQGPALLSPATRAAMLTDQVEPAQKTEGSFFPGFWKVYGWGLGLGLFIKDGVAPRFGWDGGFGTSLWCEPARGIVAVLLTQRMYDPVFLALRDGALRLAFDRDG